MDRLKKETHRRNNSVALALVFSLTGFSASSAAVEEAHYTVILHENDCELRQYSPHVTAEIWVKGDRSAAGYRGFRALAGYIFGGNDRRQSIAMTAPVVETPSQEQDMTSRVLQTASGGDWVVRFVLPSALVLASLPRPDNAAIKLIDAPAQRVASIRFSGLIGQNVLARNFEALATFMKSRNLHATGPASLAQYDPPWTLWFLRRNEILIPVETPPPPPDPK